MGYVDGLCRLGLYGVAGLWMGIWGLGVTGEGKATKNIYQRLLVRFSTMRVCCSVCTIVQI